MLNFSNQTPDAKRGPRLPWNSPANLVQCPPGARACMRPTQADFDRVRNLPNALAHRELQEVNSQLRTQQLRDEIAAKRALLR
jgi:hypothetical protein